MKDSGAAGGDVSPPGSKVPPVPVDGTRVALLSLVTAGGDCAYTQDIERTGEVITNAVKCTNGSHTEEVSVQDHATRNEWESDKRVAFSEVWVSYLAIWRTAGDVMLVKARVAVTNTECVWGKHSAVTTCF